MADLENGGKLWEAPNGSAARQRGWLSLLEDREGQHERVVSLKVTSRAQASRPSALTDPADSLLKAPPARPGPRQGSSRYPAW